MKIDARLFVRLYPRAWRERYGEELMELAGRRVPWSIGMDIAKSGIRERLINDGYSPIRFAGLLMRLIVAFAAFVSSVLIAKIVDFYYRFPDRSLSSGLAGSFVRSMDIASLGEMWLMYALFATLLAVVVNGMGWRERRPRAAAWLVRCGIATGILVAFAANELPRHFHMSRFNYYGVAVMLIAAVVVGLVVESAKLGRRLGSIAR